MVGPVQIFRVLRWSPLPASLVFFLLCFGLSFYSDSLDCFCDPWIGRLPGKDMLHFAPVSLFFFACDSSNWGRKTADCFKSEDSQNRSGLVAGHMHRSRLFLLP